MKIILFLIFKSHFADNYQIADKVYYINNNIIAGEKKDIAQIIYRNNLDLKRIYLILMIMILLV